MIVPLVRFLYLSQKRKNNNHKPQCLMFRLIQLLNSTFHQSIKASNIFSIIIENSKLAL